MPAISSTRLESIAETNPELYEILRDFQDQLNQVLPFVLSGTSSPEALVPAQSGSLYVQRSALSGPTTLHVKDTGTGNTGWAKLGAFGSIPPKSGSGFQFVVTGTTIITWYWDGTNGSSVLTIYRADGTTTQVPAANIQVTGLAPGNWYFYPYFDERTKSVQWVAGPSGNPAIAWSIGTSNTAAQAQALTQRIPMSSGGMLVNIPGGGGGSGGGGGGGGGGSGGRFQ